MKTRVNVPTAVTVPTPVTVQTTHLVRVVHPHADAPGLEVVYLHPGWLARRRGKDHLKLTRSRHNKVCRLVLQPTYGCVISNN